MGDLLAFRDLRLSRLGAMAGGGGDTMAPVISGESYDTGTDTLTLTVSEAVTLYALHNASATPLTAAAIEAGAEVTQALAAGTGFISWDDSAWATGTWYLHVAVKDAAGNTDTIAPIEHIIGATGPFAVEFDGTNDWLHTTGMSAPAASKTGALVFTFRVVANWPNGPYMLNFRRTSAGRVRVTLARNTSGGPPTDRGRLSFTLLNSAGSTVGTLTTANGLFLIDTWYTVAVSWNTATQTWVVRYLPDGGSWTTPTYTGVPSMTLNAFVDTTPDAVIGAIDSAGASIMTNWYASQIWYGPNQLPDFTSPTELAKFIPTAAKGTDGSTPTGTAPLVFLSGPAANYATNKGTGTGFTTAGALTDAPSVPT